MELAAGQRWRFRYLLDGARWENDWAADDYIRNEFGGEDSVVDLTDISTPTAPDAPAAGTDNSAGTRRRKPPAASDAPAAPAPAAPAPAAPAAPRACPQQQARCYGHGGGGQEAGGDRCCHGRDAEEDRGAPSGTDGAAKKPAATTRRKPATPRQASGKDS